MTDAAHLLAAFREAGVTVALNTTGDGLKLRAAIEPSADLLAQIRAAKPALLAHLASQRQTVARRPYPDWALIGAQPGHCGSCARWREDADWGPFMGHCAAPTAAYWPEAVPLAIHAGHACIANGRYRFQRRIGDNQLASQAPHPRLRMI